MTLNGTYNIFKPFFSSIFSSFTKLDAECLRQGDATVVVYYYARPYDSAQKR